MQEVNNSVSLQVLSLPELSKTQVKSVFNEDKILSIFSKEELKKINKIIISGCGDSYSAGAVASYIISSEFDIDVKAYDPMDGSRFLTAEDVIEDNPENTLAIIVSAGGGASRIVEMVTKFQEIGVQTVLVSNKTESKAASVAKKLFIMETPPLCDTPGLRSYYASMLGVTALGCYIGNLKAGRDVCEFLKYGEKIEKVMTDYAGSLEEADKLASMIGERYKDFTEFEVVGDGSEFFSAQFVEEKFIECGGVVASHVDSEDWCHINVFVNNPKEIPVVVIANKYKNNYSRVVETVMSAKMIGRPTVVVSNGEKSDFIDGIEFFKLPDTGAMDAYLLSTVDFIPGSLIAGYQAYHGGKDFFGSYDFSKRSFDTEKAKAKGTFAHGTTGSSEVVVVK